ncbi:hypothetical protein OAT15_02290 [Gammaproteobacteria bacterium]|jgi:hypothetical protein|nr:hypothetical protein [Gammaproteobacteria bacterium]
MKSLNNLWKPLAVVFLVASCATTPTVVVEPFDSSKTYMADFDTTWSKLVKFMSTNQISIGTIEKDSGLITLNGDNLSKDLVLSYCASNPVGWPNTTTGGKAQGNVSITEVDGFVTANVNVRFNVQGQYCYQGCSYVNYQCQSNGNFEKSLLNALD